MLYQVKRNDHRKLKDYYTNLTFDKTDDENYQFLYCVYFTDEATFHVSEEFNGYNVGGNQKTTSDTEAYVR